jgi:hypothetical protein
VHTIDSTSEEIAASKAGAASRLAAGTVELIADGDYVHALDQTTKAGAKLIACQRELARLQLAEDPESERYTATVLHMTVDELRRFVR